MDLISNQTNKNHSQHACAQRKADQKRVAIRINPNYSTRQMAMFINLNKLKNIPIEWYLSSARNTHNPNAWISVSEWKKEAAVEYWEMIYFLNGKNRTRTKKKLKRITQTIFQQTRNIEKLFN